MFWFSEHDVHRLAGPRQRLEVELNVDGHLITANLSDKMLGSACVQSGCLSIAAHHRTVFLHRIPLDHDLRACRHSAAPYNCSRESSDENQPSAAPAASDAGFDLFYLEIYA
jgi:hypothetical protein